MKLSALERLGLLEHALDTRERWGGMEEAVFPAGSLKEILRKTRKLEAEGYSCEQTVDKVVYWHGWSNCFVIEEKDRTCVVRITDIAQCPTSRIVEGRIDWAGLSIPVECSQVLVAGPARKRGAMDWSIATYFYGPTDLSTAASWVEAKLKEQSPRVVGPWALPDEVRFDVRVRAVDATVWLRPRSLHKARYLFQRSQGHPQDDDVEGVLVEISGLETLPEI